MYTVEALRCKPAWKRIHPAEKIAFACLQITLCLLSSQWLVCLLSALTSICLLMIAVPEQRRFALTFILLPIAFLFPACIAVAITSGGEGFINLLYVGSFTLGVTPESLQSSMLLFIQAFACSSATIFVGITSPIDHIEYLLHRFRFPSVFIELFGQTYRFIGLLVDTFMQIQLAQKARGVNSSVVARIQGAGVVANALLSKALWYQHWQTLSAEGRLYQGGYTYNVYSFEFSWKRIFLVVFHTAVLLFLQLYNRIL